MAKKQKAKDKSDLKDESIEIETHMDVENSTEEDLDSSIEENSEIPRCCRKN